MSASALIKPVEAEGLGGSGVIAAVFGDVQVASVFDGRNDGSADGGQVGRTRPRLRVVRTPRSLSASRMRMLTHVTDRMLPFLPKRPFPPVAGCPAAAARILVVPLSSRSAAFPRRRCGCQSRPVGNLQPCQYAVRRKKTPDSTPTTVPVTAGSPSSVHSTCMLATITATDAYRELPPNMAGTRWSITSRAAPPPTAVRVPSRTAGSQPRPASSVFCAPAAAHRLRAEASRAMRIRSQRRPETSRMKARPVPASAVGI
jgi:hypothetical protein